MIPWKSTRSFSSCRRMSRGNATKAVIALFVLAAAARGQHSDLNTAFSAVRRGDLTVVANLSVTTADLPELIRYSHDPNESVRLEAEVLLSTLGTAGCRPIATLLTDRSQDIRERAARSIYKNCPPEANINGLDASLRKSIEMGNSAAQAILLLGRMPHSAVSERVEHRGQSVKLEPWTPPVPSELAFAVISSAASDNLIDRALIPQSEAEFLAATLPDVGSAAKLRILLKLLDDRRPVADSAPSGAEPKRRVCDLAVDGFVRRLKLQPSFAPGIYRYSSENLEETKRLVERALSTAQ